MTTAANAASVIVLPLGQNKPSLPEALDLADNVESWGRHVNNSIGVSGTLDVKPAACLTNCQMPVCHGGRAVKSEIISLFEKGDSDGKS